MIILNYEKNKYTTDEPTYLYVIAEIYKTHSSRERPLTDTDVVSIMVKNYGYKSIDRHIIKRYREKLEDFGYIFEKPLDSETGQIKPRSGYYLDSVTKTFSDEQLLTLCLLSRTNKSFEILEVEEFTENVKPLISSFDNLELLEQIEKIELIDSSETSESFKLTDNIKLLLLAIKDRRLISFSHNSHVLKNQKGEKYRLYPQCVFVKNNEFYFLGTSYISKNNTLVSHNYVFRLSHISEVELTKYTRCDSHQKEYGNLTIYKANRESETIKINDFLKNISSFHEGFVYPANFHLEEAKFQTKQVPQHLLIGLLEELKEMYGDKISFKTIRSWNEEKDTYSATITMKANKEELINVAIINAIKMKLISPISMKKLIIDRLDTAKLIVEKYL